MKIELSGLIVAPFTPMHQDGSVNEEAFPKYIEHLVENKVANVFVLGTTGEGTSLSVAERKHVLEKWVQYGKNKFQKIIAHVGCCDLQTTTDLATHAASVGANAIAVVPPFYYKTIDAQQVYQWMKEVANCVPETPILYYHLPSFTGINIDLVDLLRLSCANIPNFCGVKYSDSDLIKFGTCVDLFKDEVNLCYGTDENLYFASLLGFKAFVGSSFNFLGKHFHNMLDAVSQKDMKTATSIYLKTLNALRTMNTNGYRLGMQKTLTSRVSGVDLGPVRLPNCQTNEGDEVIIKQVMQLMQNM